MMVTGDPAQFFRIRILSFLRDRSFVISLSYEHEQEQEKEGETE